MGLSSEERISKFFWSAQGWRKKLGALKEAVGHNPTSHTSGREYADEIVHEWIRELDWMVGYVQQHSGNPGNVFWILGEGDKSLQGLRSDPYSLRRDAEPPDAALQKIHGPPEYETARWWSEEADHEMTAARLEFYPFKSHPHLHALAVWWDMYGYISSMAYPIFRYDDGLFSPSITDRFYRLSGEMINRRFDVVFGTDTDNVERTEQYLLLKHRAFHMLLHKETEKLQGNAYFETKFDGYKLYERVAQMSAKELSDLFEAEREARYKQSRAYDENEAAKKKQNVKADGLFGPPIVPPSDPELLKALKPKKPKKGKR